jgi:hypothetical protein
MTIFGGLKPQNARLYWWCFEWKFELVSPSAIKRRYRYADEMTDGFLNWRGTQRRCVIAHDPFSIHLVDLKWMLPLDRIKDGEKGQGRVESR